VFGLAAAVGLLLIKRGTRQEADLTPPYPAEFIDAAGFSHQEALKAEGLLTNDFVVRMTVRPAFKPLSEVSLQYVATRQATDRKTYHLRCSTADSNVTRETAVGDAKGASANYSHVDLEFPGETGDAVKAVWLGMLNRTHYEKADSIGLDGTSYNFSARPLEHGGRLDGFAWEPQGGSRVGKLKDIGVKLLTYCAASSSDRAFLAAAIKEDALALKSDIRPWWHLW
jgi:hypothetical protein